MLAEGVPHAVEALIELVKFGKDRERLAAAKELLSWAVSSDSDEDLIQLCAVAPEVLTLDQVREEAERRRLAAVQPMKQIEQVEPESADLQAAFQRARAYLEKLSSEG